MTKSTSYQMLREAMMVGVVAALVTVAPVVARAEGDATPRPVATDTSSAPNVAVATTPTAASDPKPVLPATGTAAPAPTTVSAPVPLSVAEPATTVQPALTPGRATHLPNPAATQEKPAHDLSPWAMFMSADTVVKSIMGLLLAASIATWTIFVGKLSQLARERRALDRATHDLRSVKSLTGLGPPATLPSIVVANLVAAAILELRLSDAPGTQAGIKERVASRLREVEIANARHIRGGTGILATIGSVGPFIGLLGTVWGIMNSFIGIAASGTTNLAVVAPGIAEALMATAMGLFAAIPAVVVYNHFARATARYLEAVGTASGEVARLVSRDLDRNASGQPRAMAAE